MFVNIKKDIKRYNEPDSRFHWEEISLISVVLFRIGKSIRAIRIGLLRAFLNILFVPIYIFFSLITGIQIPRGCTIGPGLRIYHFGCIVLNPMTVIGKNCTLRHGVTVGNRQTVDDVPVIGDHVDIGAGAKILGKIRIGNNVSIGANAVVITDVPDNYIAVGVPARIFPKKSGV